MLNIIEEYKTKRNKQFFIERLRKAINEKCFSNEFTSNILISKNLISNNFDLLNFINKYSDVPINNYTYSIDLNNCFMSFEIRFDYLMLNIRLTDICFDSYANENIRTEIKLYAYPNSRICNDNIIIDENTIERYDL